MKAFILLGDGQGGKQEGIILDYKSLKRYIHACWKLICRIIG